MSADNGIYILEYLTPDRSNTEYRVTHAQAIDNVWYGVDNGQMNAGELFRYFGDCTPIKDRRDALVEADKIQQEVGYTEYGISFLPKYNDTFPTKEHEA